MFDALYGNQAVKAYLERAVQENSLPQTLLFEGAEGIGKSLFAKELAACLLESSSSRIAKETHPDLHVLRPEGRSGLHPIDELRKCTGRLYEAPFEAKRKFCIIYDAERMQAPSANALLKTLEEPPLDTTIVLLTSQAKEMLPTILSRCIQLHFQPLPLEDTRKILTSQGFSADFALLAHGSASRALLLAADASFGNVQRLLLELVSKPLFYPDLTDALENMETLLEEVKEEDPVAYHRRVQWLFATLLMWARDQVLHPIGGASLFFPEVSPRRLPCSLSSFERFLQEAQTAFQRNIKLSACLQYCLSKVFS